MGGARSLRASRHGGVGQLDTALEVIDAESEIHAAVLDVNLGGESVFPAADNLMTRAVPMVFTTGYDASSIPPRYAHIPRCEKPVTMANWTIPHKMVPGMGGAMDLVSGAKRVVVAMQHSAKGKPKIVPSCTLPITSTRRVDLLVTELAVIGFPDGEATLLETAPGVSVDQVVAATEAVLAIPDHVREMAL